MRRPASTSTIGGMGIRYYAYPVRPEHTAAAAATPELFLGQDPLSDAWGLTAVGESIHVMGTRSLPEMLYLDKCWNLLQDLTRIHAGQYRPAHALLEGYGPDGRYDCQPFLKALAPAEVAAAASDLAAISCEDLDDFLGHDARGRAKDRDYLKKYLEEAVDFTASLRSRGWGLVYMIG